MRKPDIVLIFVVYLNVLLKCSLILSDAILPDVTYKKYVILIPKATNFADIECFSPTHYLAGTRI